MSRKELRCVTITGADDSDDPSELVELSKEFPFVEWGILFSPKRTGTQRYPSKEWVGRLSRAFNRGTGHGNGFAAHLCGQAARDTIAGDARWLNGLDWRFSRVQLNGFSDCTQELVTLIATHDRDSLGPLEFILQAGSESTLAEAADVAVRCLTCAPFVSALWDESGGRGLQLTTAPAPTELEDGVTEMPMGYAGGIGPDNVADVLSAIGAIGTNSYWWIDMESGVRTDDRFDLAKVRRVLEQAAAYLKGEAR